MTFVLPVGQATPQVGKSLSFAVRRDRMTVKVATDSNALAENTIVGKVSELEYQGIYMKVTIKIDGPDTASCVIYVEEMAFFAHPVTLGQRVIANWISEEGHSLLYS
jgi:putative spermidine/putrescine transport system ATP-binding protein